MVAVGGEDAAPCGKPFGIGADHQVQPQPGRAPAGRRSKAGMGYGPVGERVVVAVGLEAEPPSTDCSPEAQPLPGPAPPGHRSKAATGYGPLGEHDVPAAEGLGAESPSTCCSPEADLELQRADGNHEVPDGDELAQQPEQIPRRRSWEVGLSEQKLLKVTFLTATWWFASVGVTLQMKILVGSGGIFPFSFLLTGLTNSLTGVMSWLLVFVIPTLAVPPPMTWCEAGAVVLIGLLQSVEYAASNKSLEFISVSGRTMLLSANVLFMMLTARLWRIEALDGPRLLAGGLAMLGAAMQGTSVASYADESRSPVMGVVLLLFSMVSSSQRWALIQTLTQLSPPGSAMEVMGKTKVHLIQRTLPVAGLGSFAMAVPLEMPALPSGALLQEGVLVRVVGIAAGIVLITYAEYELVRCTSAVAMTVLSSLHSIPLLIGGAVLFHDVLQPATIGGFALCLCGAYTYARARMSDASKPTANCCYPQADQDVLGKVSSPDASLSGEEDAR